MNVKICDQGIFISLMKRSPQAQGRTPWKYPRQGQTRPGKNFQIYCKHGGTGDQGPGASHTTVRDERASASPG